MNTVTYKDQSKAPRERILEYIKYYILKHYYPPTIREIAKGVGLKSSASVYEHMKTLIHFGLIETDAEAGTPRAIRLPNMKITIE